MLISSNSATMLLARTAKDGASFDSSMFYLILALVGVFSGIIFLVFFKTRILPLFRLWYISLVYGKYSFEFLEFFKENNLRNPHNNCIKDEITLHFLLFYKPMRNALYFKTNGKIEFGKVPFMQTYKSVSRLKGRPDCINIAWFLKSRVKVVGYNENLNGVRIRSLYYFLDDRFIMGEYIFSDFAKSKPAQVIGTLSAKYLNDETVTSDLFYITDPAGNMLNFENNGFSVNIRYLYKGDSHSGKVLSDLFAKAQENSVGYMGTLRNEDLLKRF